ERKLPFDLSEKLESGLVHRLLHPMLEVCRIGNIIWQRENTPHYATVLVLIDHFMLPEQIHKIGSPRVIAVVDVDCPSRMKIVFYTEASLHLRHALHNSCFAKQLHDLCRK